MWGTKQWLIGIQTVLNGCISVLRAVYGNPVLVVGRPVFTMRVLWLNDSGVDIRNEFKK